MSVEGRAEIRPHSVPKPGPDAKLAPSPRSPSQTKGTGCCGRTRTDHQNPVRHGERGLGTISGNRAQEWASCLKGAADEIHSPPPRPASSAQGQRADPPQPGPQPWAPASPHGRELSTRCDITPRMDVRLLGAGGGYNQGQLWGAGPQDSVMDLTTSPPQSLDKGLKIAAINY